MLKVVFVTQDEPFYLPQFFRELLSLWGNRAVEVHGVVIQKALGKKSSRDLARQMYDFYGAVDFIRVGVRYATRKLLGVIAESIFSGAFPGAFSVRHVLRKGGWKILEQTNVNAPEFVSFVKSAGVDLIVSVAASQVFKREVLAAARWGCVNIHTARLPKNRGMLPNFWALLRSREEPESAITIHKMDETLDSGPIILQETFRLDPSESLHSLIIRTKRLGARLMLKVLDLYQEGEPMLLPNDASQATYNHFPGPDDVREFRRRGLKLL